MKIYPHLCFDGQCEEAFLEYQRILGGTIITMMKYGESPMAKEVASIWHNKIIHATLQSDEFELAGADFLPKDYKKPQGFFVILNILEKLAAKQIFESLSVGGEVQFPFEETFWSAGFGALVDRFGIPWEINCNASPTLE
jgi:PhnB protein